MILGLALIFLVAIINSGYFFYKLRQWKSVMALYETGEYKKFVGEMEELISGTQNRYLQNIMKLNLGAGYQVLNQPEKLVGLYESTDVKYLKSKDLKLFIVSIWPLLISNWKISRPLNVFSKQTRIFCEL